MRLGGFIAWWIWRTIYLMKLPGWYRRLKVCIDWSVALFFPRDICQLDTRRSERFGREHYEPGQVIVEQGDSGDTFYSIAKGEVVVVRKEDDAEKVLARLKAGDHFGEEALLTGKPRSATVRAATAVDVLCLGRHDFDELARNIAVVGRALTAERTERTADAAKTIALGEEPTADASKTVVL
jgi:NADH dehydrogenase